MEDIMQELRTKKINNDGFIVIGRDYCGFCRRAKLLLHSKNISLIYINLDDYDPTDSYKSELIELTNMKTIPIIFYNNQLIGGFTELSAYLGNNS
jgi:glutaredoxin